MEGIFHRKQLDLFDWQKRVLSVIEATPDDRTIYFVIGEPGVGKSTFINHELDYVPRVWTTDLPENGQVREWAHEFHELDFVPNAIVIDCPMETQCSDVPWRFIEKMKNGKLRSTKYMGGSYKFDHPHILFFCNRELWKRDDGECVIAENRVVVIKAE